MQTFNYFSKREITLKDSEVALLKDLCSVRHRVIAIKYLRTAYDLNLIEACTVYEAVTEIKE